MKIIIAENYLDMSKKASLLVGSMVLEKENIVLGLSSGSTPLGLYQELIRLFNEGVIDFSKTITFNLDEYRGIGREQPQSYYHYMHKNFFNHINIPEENIHIPDGLAENLQEEIRRYEKKIEKYQIDLQILGIGRNGHIGFNEPGTSFDSKTHIAKLTYDTRKANSRFFGEISKVPEEAITMGISTIMKSKKIILLASGIEKARAIKEMIEGEITTSLPASVLRKHKNTISIIDREASSLLKPINTSGV